MQKASESPGWLLPISVSRSPSSLQRRRLWVFSKQCYGVATWPGRQGPGGLVCGACLSSPWMVLWRVAVFHSPRTRGAACRSVLNPALPLAPCLALSLWGPGVLVQTAAIISPGVRGWWGFK